MLVFGIVLLLPLAASGNPHDASDFFIFSRAEFGKFAEANCNGSNDKQADVSGSNNEYHGRIHSHADLAVSGAINKFFYALTYGTHDEDCQLQAEPQNPPGGYFAGTPSEVDEPLPLGRDTFGWPGDLGSYLDAAPLQGTPPHRVTFSSVGQALPGETCDALSNGTPTSLSGTSDITLSPADSGKVICNGTGKTQLNISGVSAQNPLIMSITILSHGSIEISGQNVKLSPAVHNILAFTDQESSINDVSIKLAGSNFDVPQRAILFSPRSGQDVSGSDDSEMCIQLIGQGRIKSAGSNSKFGPGLCRQLTNIKVTKSDSPDPVIAGNNITYTLLVENTTSIPAEAVIVNDNLPEEVTFVSAVASQGTGCTNQAADPEVTCNLGTLGANASATVTIVVTVPALQSLCGQTLTNNVAVTTVTEESSTSDNTDTETTGVICTNIKVTKSDDPDPVPLGGTLTYTVLVENTTAIPALNVVMNDNLPEEVTFVSATPSQGGPCTSQLPDPEVTCPLGTLGPNASATVTIVVTVSTNTALCGGTLTNNVAVSTTTPETNLADNTDTELTTVQCTALRINKDSTKGGPVLVAGATFTVSPHPTAGQGTFTVIDNGTNDADPVTGEICVTPVIPGIQYTITETAAPTGYGLPADTTETVTPAAGGTCASGAGSVTFLDPPLADIQVRFDSQVPGEASLTVPLSCTVPNSTGTSSTAGTADWDNTLTITGIRVLPSPQIVQCTINIDP